MRRHIGRFVREETECSPRPDRPRCGAKTRAGGACLLRVELKRHAAVFTVDCPRARRPRQAAGALRMHNGTGGTSFEQHKQATPSRAPAPDRPPSPLEGAFTQTAGAAATRYFRSRTRACARAIRRRDRPKPSGRDCSLRAVIEVPSSIVEPRLPCPEAAPPLVDEGRRDPAHRGRRGQLYCRTTGRSASDPL